MHWMRVKRGSTQESLSSYKIKILTAIWSHAIKAPGLFSVLLVQLININASVGWKEAVAWPDTDKVAVSCSHCTPTVAVRSVYRAEDNLQ